MALTTVDQFIETLATEGFVPALGRLNRSVPHRYTGVYRLATGQLENVQLFDKHGEVRPEFLAVVPFEDSFCQFVLRDGGFETRDSGSDERLNGHKYQGVLLSYSGVPIEDSKGGLWGTLCHFDPESCEISEQDFQDLLLAAKALQAYLLQVAGPSTPGHR